MSSLALPALPPELKRPTMTLAVWAVVSMLLVWAYQGAEINFGALLQNRGNIAELASGFFPPDFTRWSDYLREMLITIQIAVWGTFLAVMAAVPLGLMGAKNIGPRWLVLLVRRFMDACRAINEMVFALLFVAAVGLGPFAGVLALFIHTTGVLGKLFSESVEAIDPKPVEGIRSTGASLLAEIRFGVLPQVMPLWSSFALYRFESNVRSATVLGIIGAGGIGQSLYEAIRGFSYPEAAAIMLIIIGCVMALDLLSGQVRKLMV
jgi:phosphonate transport system permease protein